MAGIKETLFVNSEKRDRDLAVVLGISYDELLQLNYTVETDTDAHGTPLGTFISINDQSDAAIVRKMKYQPDSAGVIYLDRLAFPVE